MPAARSPSSHRPEREKLRAARATHLAGIRAMYLDLFTPAELEQLGDSWDRVLDATGWGCCK